MILFALTFCVLAADKPVTLVAPDFSGSRGSEELAKFAGDHFAQRLSMAGLRVLTSSEVATALGVERQKQLLGCTDSTACLVEFADALNADALVVGSLAKLDELLVANIKVVKSDGTVLSVFSARAKSQSELVDVLEAGAQQVANEVLSKFGRATAKTSWGSRQWSIVPAGLGIAFIGGGAAMLALRLRSVDSIQGARGPDEVAHVFQAASDGERLGTAGAVLLGIGIAAGAGAALMYGLGSDLKASAMITPEGAVFGLAGSLP